MIAALARDARHTSTRLHTKLFREYYNNELELFEPMFFNYDLYRGAYDYIQAAVGIVGGGGGSEGDVSASVTFCYILLFLRCCNCERMRLSSP